MSEPRSGQPGDMEDFVREVRTFLDASAARLPNEQAIAWGEGPDRITYFGDDSAEESARAVDAARGQLLSSWVFSSNQYYGL